MRSTSVRHRATHPARVVTSNVSRHRRPISASSGRAPSILTRRGGRVFLEGRRSTGGCRPRRQDQAAAACRRALIIDPELVPAIVNLANIHYARATSSSRRRRSTNGRSCSTGSASRPLNLGNIHHDLSRYQGGGRLLPGKRCAQPRIRRRAFLSRGDAREDGTVLEAKPHWRIPAPRAQRRMG